MAKWVAACDQPFTSVEDPEFRELLEYTHHPARKVLKIPGAKAVKRRIMELGEEMVESMKEVFKVCRP